MTLNGVMTLTLRYFTKFGKPALKPLTASSSIELIVQKSASITHRTVKLVRVTKFMHLSVDTITQIYWTRLTLLTYNLPSKSFTLRQVAAMFCCVLAALASSCTPCFRKKTASTHIIGYKLRISCLILIIFDIKIPHII